jgi:hypothetical protein
LVGKQIDFMSGISPPVGSTCHVTPASDDMFPGPPSRQQWQRVDWSN